jgi:hypothetical protein
MTKDKDRLNAVPPALPGFPHYITAAQASADSADNADTPTRRYADTPIRRQVAVLYV